MRGYHEGQPHQQRNPCTRLHRYPAVQRYIETSVYSPTVAVVDPVLLLNTVSPVVAAVAVPVSVLRETAVAVAATHCPRHPLYPYCPTASWNPQRLNSDLAQALHRY